MISGGRHSWCNVADDGTMIIYDVPDPYDRESQPIMGVPIKVPKKNGEELASSHYVRVPLELNSYRLRETGQRGMYTQHLKVCSSQLVWACTRSRACTSSHQPMMCGRIPVKRHLHAVAGEGAAGRRRSVRAHSQGRSWRHGRGARVAELVSA